MLTLEKKKSLNHLNSHLKKLEKEQNKPKANDGKNKEQKSMKLETEKQGKLNKKLFL